jgi:hypothetical protein
MNNYREQKIKYILENTSQQFYDNLQKYMPNNYVTMDILIILQQAINKGSLDKYDIIALRQQTFTLNKILVDNGQQDIRSLVPQVYDIKWFVNQVENFDLDKRDQTSTKVKWLIVVTCLSVLIYAVLFGYLYHV